MGDKDTSALREMFQYSPLAEKPFDQWEIATHWRALQIQDMRRLFGLVKMTYSGDNWWCPCWQLLRMLTTLSMLIISAKVIKLTSWYFWQRNRVKNFNNTDSVVNVNKLTLLLLIIFKTTYLKSTKIHFYCKYHHLSIEALYGRKRGHALMIGNTIRREKIL